MSAVVGSPLGSLQYGCPGSAVGAPRPGLAEARAARSPPSQHGTMK
jgi:hypothetical protein